MTPQVDSLNIGSKTKPLSVVSMPENNSNTAVFENKSSKSNIDEFSFSNANCNSELEEKANNKRKWLIGAGIILGTVAIGVASKKAPKNILKPQISDTNPKINSLIHDMTEFLTVNKGKHIGSDDIVNIFKKHQPDINLNVIDDVIENSFGMLSSGAIAGAEIAEDLSRYTSYIMKLSSKSFMDKLKKLLHIKNNKKEFYVTNSFAEILLHESTHVMQHVTKPDRLAYQRTLQSSLHSKGGWINGFNIDNDLTYRDLVYKGELFFKKNKFIKKLMRQIKAPYYMKDREEMVAVQLKQLIRKAQAEKQAYELGKLSQLRYKFPSLSQNKRIDAYFQKRAIKYADAFKWGDKIEMMKKEYFNLIQEIRKNHVI